MRNYAQLRAIPRNLIPNGNPRQNILYSGEPQIVVKPSIGTKVS